MAAIPSLIVHFLCSEGYRSVLEIILHVHVPVIVRTAAVQSLRIDSNSADPTVSGNDIVASELNSSYVMLYFSMSFGVLTAHYTIIQEQQWRYSRCWCCTWPVYKHMSTSTRPRPSTFNHGLSPLQLADRTRAEPLDRSIQKSSFERAPQMILLFLFMIPRLSIPLYDLKSG